jgi:hypothetical protein
MVEREPILIVLFVITKCFLHRGRKMDFLHTYVNSFNAPRRSKIGKRLYADFHMATPAMAWLIYVLVLAPVLFKKAHRQIRGKFISELLLAGKFDEVFPDRPIPIP